jgi:hypothetical protein
LPKRTDSKQSWTMDFSARLQKALEEARPHREKAAELSAQAKLLEDKICERRKAKNSRTLNWKKSGKLSNAKCANHWQRAIQSRTPLMI